jgi:hypothetical protein
MEQIAVSNGWADESHLAVGASCRLHRPAPFGKWDAWDGAFHPTRNARNCAAARTGKPNVQDELDFSRPKRPIFIAVPGGAGDQLNPASESRCSGGETLSLHDEQSFISQRGHASRPVEGAENGT